MTSGSFPRRDHGATQQLEATPLHGRTGSAKRRWARATSSSASRVERSDWPAMTISSAGNVGRASAIACSGSASPTRPSCVDSGRVRNDRATRLLVPARGCGRRLRPTPSAGATSSAPEPRRGPRPSRCPRGSGRPGRRRARSCLLCSGAVGVESRAVMSQHAVSEIYSRARDIQTARSFRVGNSPVEERVFQAVRAFWTSQVRRGHAAGASSALPFVGPCR